MRRGGGCGGEVVQAFEVARKPHGGIGADTGPLANDVVDARSRHVQGLRQRIRAETERSQKILSQYFTGMNRAHAVLDHGSSPLMAVNDLDVFCAGRRPAKTKAELIVHADAVPSCTAALQGLEPVTRWRAQKFQGLRRIQLRQLARRDGRDARKPPALAGLEQRLRGAVRDVVYARSTPDPLTPRLGRRSPACECYSSW
jgi:hypothetical protein